MRRRRRYQDERPVLFLHSVHDLLPATPQSGPESVPSGDSFSSPSTSISIREPMVPASQTSQVCAQRTSEGKPRKDRATSMPWTRRTVRNDRPGITLAWEHPSGRATTSSTWRGRAPHFGPPPRPTAAASSPGTGAGDARAALVRHDEDGPALAGCCPARFQKRFHLAPDHQGRPRGRPLPGPIRAPSPGGPARQLPGRPRSR